MSWLELYSSSGALASLEIAFRLLLAVALAGVLGWDREEKDRPAGLRTYMLVALAAALFTVLTFEIFETVNARNPESSSDPIRIIEAVTAGVAFLAAGTIIQGRKSVRGITTGAGMWMAGALGVAVGAGHYVLAIFAALLSFSILRFAQALTAHDARAKAAQGERPKDATLIIEDQEDEQTG